MSGTIAQTGGIQGPVLASIGHGHSGHQDVEQADVLHSNHAFGCLLPKQSSEGCHWLDINHQCPQDIQQ